MKGMARGLALLALGAAISSCGLPRPRPPAGGLPVPERFVSADPEASAPAHPPAWWTVWGDTNLNRWVAEALEGNQDLAVAAARWEAAVAQARIAGADLYPSLGLGFDAQRNQRNFIGFPIPGAGGDNVLTTRSTTYGLNLNASWELDLWGRVRAGRNAAAAETEAAGSDWRAAQLSLAAQVVKGWAALMEARRLAALASSTVDSYRQTANEVRSRYERGIRPPLDLRLALANLAGAEALLRQRRVALDQAVRQLELLLGKYPSGQLAADGERDFPELTDEVPAGLPSELLGRRPDVAAAGERLRAADWRVAQANAALLPRISLTGSGGTSTDDLAELLNPDFKVWTLAGNLAQPLFEGGRLAAGVDLSKARVREALAAYRGTVLRAFGEVESALSAEAQLSAREADLAEAAAQSSQALRLARLRYQVGLDNFITVLEAQRRSLEAETQWVAVRRLRLDNRANLHLALGGGFSSQDLPAAEPQ